jgi:hypothetical protein
MCYRPKYRSESPARDAAAPAAPADAGKATRADRGKASPEVAVEEADRPPDLAA